MARPVRRWIIATILIGVSAVVIALSVAPRPPLLEQVAVHRGGVAFPGHVIRAYGYYIATEIFSGRIAFSAEPSFAFPLYAHPPESIASLRSPHYLAVDAANRLLVTEGWGAGVVRIDRPAATSWHRYSGAGRVRLNAPHGVCVAADGWIYVADSLNSRIVRYRDEDPQDWQVFADHERLVGYGRQLLCRDDGVWISNSYERRPGINPGDGGNVLRIDDFDSGVAEIVASFPDTNITGIAVIADRHLVVGLWGAAQKMAIVDLVDGGRRQQPRPSGVTGPPYGFHFDEAARRLLVTHIGDIHGRTDSGAIVVYRVNP